MPIGGKSCGREGASDEEEPISQKYEKEKGDIWQDGHFASLAERGWERLTLSIWQGKREEGVENLETRSLLCNKMKIRRQGALSHLTP